MKPNATTELIEPRSDERLDEARLGAWLAEHVEGFDGPIEILQFPGGHSNLTYRIRAGDREIVLRRPPLGPVAPKAHDMGREFRVLSRLSPFFPPAPRALAFCDDPEVLGAPFYVMERRTGVVIRQSVPAELGTGPEVRRRASETLIETLADLHAVDYEAAGLGDLGKPDGYVERQVRGWAERWERAKTREMPDFDRLRDWLLDRLPESGDPTIVHNDYKFDNVMFGPGDPGRIVGVLDWEMCTLGDPLIDVGTLLGYWREQDDPPFLGASLSSPTVEEGFPTRDELASMYAERSGRDLSHLPFYVAFAYYKTAVVIEQIYVRFVRGQTKDDRFEKLGQLVPHLVRAAAETAEASKLA